MAPTSHPLISFLILSIHLYPVLSETSIPNPPSSKFLSSSRFLSEGVYLSISEGYWGDWTLPIEVPENYIACGLGLRIEPPQGAGDDTAANAVKIYYCYIDNWNLKNDLNLNEGLWGDWNWAMCPQGYYINQVRARVESPQGPGDDTALNSLTFRCKEPVNSNVSDDIILQNTNWGNWMDWVGNDDQYVCGGQVRFEPSQEAGDDTALNGIRLRFCEYAVR
jgi:hypothetical protein